MLGGVIDAHVDLNLVNKEGYKASYYIKNKRLKKQMLKMEVTQKIDKKYLQERLTYLIRDVNMLNNIVYYLKN